MKNGTIFLCLIIVLTACKTKKAATGGTAEQAPASNTSTEKLLTGRWVIDDITLPAELVKPVDTAIAAMPLDTAIHNCKDSLDHTEAPAQENTPLQVLKEKSYIVFNANHTFQFVGPTDDAGDKGTWKLTEGGDIAGTNTKGKETVFKSNDLSRGRFDMSVYPAEGKEGEGKGPVIILHFKRAAK